MKLEIDIPSIIYNDAKENRGYISVGKMEIAWKAIADGKPLEQEQVLDKIRAEIEQEIIPRNSDQYDHEAMWQNCGLRMALKAIDKNISESEE